MAKPLFEPLGTFGGDMRNSGQRGLDAATGWSVGLWLVFGLAPVISETVGWQKILNHQGLAAWVQAAGSIAAIWAGWVAARYQLDRQVAEKAAAEEQGELDELVALREIVKTSGETVVRLMGALDKTNFDGDLEEIRVGFQVGVEPLVVGLNVAGTRLQRFPEVRRRITICNQLLAKGAKLVEAAETALHDRQSMPRLRAHLAVSEVEGALCQLFDAVETELRDRGVVFPRSKRWPGWADGPPE